MPKPKVAVIGAGIVGAAIAFHLARRGAAVTLIDGQEPGSGVTSRSFAWINVAYGQPEPNRRLRALAIDEWHRLEQELQGTLRVDWCGALSWSADSSATERLVRDHPVLRLVEGREIAALEPGLAAPPVLAAFAAAEGAVDPAAAAAAMAAATGSLKTDVLAIETRGGRVSGLRLGALSLAVDLVVVAAGALAPTLAAPLGVGVPVTASPAVLLRFATQRPLVRRILSGPEMEVRQAGERSLLAAEDFPPGTDLAALAGSAERAIARALGGASLILQAALVGERPMPSDDLPIVGFAPGVAGLYLAVMHAGITLAPAVGRLAAEELLGGELAEALAHCRPERFSPGG